jgi:hypothetical protein
MMKDIDELITDPGWQGVYSRHQAIGAIPNGTKVRKVKSEPKDGHPDGALAVVIGSWGLLPWEKPLEIKGYTIRFFYFVEFEDMPQVGVGISEHRIQAI